METVNKWQEVKNYVNSHDKFTRKEMTKFYNGRFGHTEDQYVLFLKHCGYLKKIKIGEYERIMKVPDDISLSLITKLSYDEIERKRIFRKEKLKKIGLSN